jgi:cardiolipin synthase
MCTQHDRESVNDYPVVIDGEIGYTGGFNVGDEYLGLVEKFGYWRDNHLRIHGHAVQIR